MGEIPDIFRMAEKGAGACSMSPSSSRTTRTCARWSRRATPMTCWTSTRWEQANPPKRACTALEVVTQSRKDDDPSKFTWQRNGDLPDRPGLDSPAAGAGAARLRSVVGGIPRPARSSSASAYIYGAALDMYTKFAADSVQLANGKLSIDDSAVRQDDQRLVLAETAGREPARAPLETMTPCRQEHDQATSQGRSGRRANPAP